MFASISSGKIRWNVNLSHLAETTYCLLISLECYQPYNNHLWRISVTVIWLVTLLWHKHTLNYSPKINLLSAWVEHWLLHRPGRRPCHPSCSRHTSCRLRCAISPGRRSWSTSRCRPRCRWWALARVGQCSIRSRLQWVCERGYVWLTGVILIYRSVERTGYKSQSVLR